MNAIATRRAERGALSPMPLEAAPRYIVQTLGKQRRLPTDIGGAGLRSSFPVRSEHSSSRRRSPEPTDGFRGARAQRVCRARAGSAGSEQVRLHLVELLTGNEILFQQLSELREPVDRVSAIGLSSPLAHL